MSEATIRLAQAMMEAERERRAWNAGRIAFREKGHVAMNPNGAGTPDHTLWAEGFAYERARQAPAGRSRTMADIAPVS